MLRADGEQVRRFDGRDGVIQTTMAMDFTKRHRRSLISGYRLYRNRFADTEMVLKRPQLGRLLDHFDLLAVDHGIFRFAYLNLHEVAPGVWRSAQPGPGHIRRMAKRGVKTVINLRGMRDCGSYRLEEQACARHGVKLVNFKMGSRAAPKRKLVRRAASLFETIEYPVLIHCKSGADRAGIMSALYLLMHEGRPLDEAMHQLSLRYGHFRQADTGVLDYFFDCYRAETAREPMEFMQWVRERYTRRRVNRSFQAKGTVNFIVNRMLRRE